MKLYKVNNQVYIKGVLIGVGTFNEERIGANAIPTIESYCEAQKALPLDMRDIPPCFEIIDTDKKVAETADEKLGQQLEGYVGMNIKQLKELCKQRGLKVDNKMSAPDLINLLTENDKKAISEEQNQKFTFKSADEFSAMNAKEQVNYLDDIFCMPDGVKEGSEEMDEYISLMTEVVEGYAGLSLEEDVVSKIKEIMDWANGEE